jgi:hypothetical protein
MAAFVGDHYHEDNIQNDAAVPTNKLSLTEVAMLNRPKTRKPKPTAPTPVTSIEIPAYLDVAPTGVSSLVAITLKQTLPINQLQWRDFEKLCVRLIRRQGGIVQCRLYGTEGQRQKGIDIFSRTDAGEVRVYQCKKVANFTGATLRNAVDLFSKDDWAAQAKRFVVCTSANGSSTTVADALVAGTHELKQQDIDLELWDEEEISQQLKAYPDLVHDFFGKGVLEAFLGRDVADRFSSRLSPEDVVRFRSRLSTFYTAVFSEQDQPIPLPNRPGVPSIPLLDRFVMPDIQLERDPRSLSVTVPEPLSRSSREDEAQGTITESKSANEVRNETAVQLGRQPMGTWMLRSKHSLVIGGPGTGKSALLRCITSDLLSDAPRFSSLASHWGGFLPIYVPFAFWTQEIARPGTPCGLEECLRRWLTSWSADDCWPLVSKALSDERLLILLDGLDEWTSQESANNALKMLQVFADTKQARIVASSRPDMRESIRGTDWQLGLLAPLNTNQQAHLIKLWFEYRFRLDNQGRTNAALVAEETRQFLHDIALSSDLHDLARVPLLLLLLLYLRFQNAVLPTGRFEAYEKVVDYLIESHLPHKRSSALVSGSIDIVLRPREIRGLLGFVAYSMQNDWHNGVIDRVALESLVEKHLSSADGVGLHLDRLQMRKQVDTLIDQIALASGLMVRQGFGAVSFLHRTVQEYLTGYHLATREPNHQREFLESHWRDRSWKEPILGLFSCLDRGTEIAGHLRSLRAFVDDTIDGMYARELTAELSFGPVACPPALAREVANEVFTAIERNEWRPHRVRLVRQALGGLRSLKTRDLVKAKVQQWVFYRTFGGIFDALVHWPSIPELTDALFRGLYSEDLQVQKSAAAALALHGRMGAAVKERMISVATSSLYPDRRASTLIGLSRGWPEDQTVHALIEHNRHASSPILRLAAIVAAVNCSVQNEDDLDMLLRLNNERFQDTPGYYWDRDSVNAFVKGWPQNEKLKAACEKSIAMQFRNDGELDKDIAERVYLQAFPGDPGVVDFAVKELANPKGHPFLSLHFDAFRYLGEHFTESKKLSDALDAWAPLQQFREPEIALSAPVGKTEVRKQKLIDSLRQSHPFWAAESLLTNWGMQDREVAKALTDMAMGPAGLASAIGRSIPEILLDRDKALERLLEILEDPGCSWHHWVALGIVSLKPVKDREKIVDLLMKARDKTHLINLDSLDGAIITGFGDLQKVREFAKHSLTQRSPRFWAIAEAYGNDVEMRSAVLAIANPLPIFLRAELVEGLTSIGGDDFIKDVLRDYDSEVHDETKTLASIAYHRLRLGQDTSDDEQVLARNLRCYGPDYEERRRAAFAGLVVLHRLEVMLADEQFGSTNRALSISLGEIHRPNNSLLNLIGDEFEYIEKTLGSSVKVRLSGHLGSPNPFALIAAVAYGRPALEQHIWTEVADDANFAIRPQVLKFLSVQRPCTSFLKDMCVKALFYEGQDFDRVAQLDVAVEVIADQFASDAELMGHILKPYPNGHFRHSQLVTLCAAWPDSDVVGEVYRHAESGGLRSFSSPDLFYAVVFARCPVASLPTHLKEAVDHVARRQMYTGRMVSALLRRLRRDESARLAFSEMLLSSSDVGLRNNLLALLAASGTLTDEQMKIGRSDLHNERSKAEGSQVAYDLFSEQFQSVAVGLMDRLGDRHGKR